jgi:Protein of unknown function (DUF2934)
MPRLDSRHCACTRKGAKEGAMSEHTDVVEESATDLSGLDAEERRRRIAEAAYYRAERRGFTPGYEEEDWLAAEQELEGSRGRDFHAEDNYFPTPK